MYRIKICVAIFMTIFINTAHSASIKDGSDIYQRQCAMCHGMSGMSSMAGAPNFKHGRGLMKPDVSLVEHLKNGRNACPSFRGILRDKDMYDVVAFIRTLYP